jgi:predicted DNA-binding transcriptional regulator AlpA
MPRHTFIQKRVPAVIDADHQRLSNRALPDALKNFDSLPDAAHVRQPVVEALFGISGPTVWRWSKSGRLPAPQKQSERVTTWNVGRLRRRLAEGGS